MTSVLRSAPAAPMLTSFTIQATLSPLTDQRAGKYPLGSAPPISRRSHHSTRHQMDVSDQCKTYRKSQELPLGTFAFRILLKRRGLSLSEFGVRMSQLSPGLLMSVHRTIQTHGPLLPTKTPCSNVLPRRCRKPPASTGSSSTVIC